MQREDAYICKKDIHHSAAHGAVIVTKPCGAARRCGHLQDWHDSAVHGTVAVAKSFDAARRCVHVHRIHYGTVHWRVSHALAEAT